MILVWCLNIVGLVLIILDVEGLSPTIYSNPHAIMGTCFFVLKYESDMVHLIKIHFGKNCKTPAWPIPGVQ